ncbi:MAG: alpha/beta hydrolase [Prolixibacteraceae bacterium]|nr:alpha/beta hydrolase [Prolixibacteraceae bacterium]
MRAIITIIIFLFEIHATAQETSYKNIENIHYYPKRVTRADAYINERCLLDIHYPENIENFATVVWFHGGGLQHGSKYTPEDLTEKGIAVVAVNYRLYPQVSPVTCIEDAAASVAWVFNNIEKYRGDSTKIFLCGHSAGGYLALMVGMDKSWLASHQIDANHIAGLIPYSGHTITHLAVRHSQGIAQEQPTIDSLAPLFHVRPDAPPLLMITGDRELEMLGRYEENAYMYRMMKVVGHTETRLMELDGYDHGMEYPAHPLLLKEINRILELKKQ